MDGDGDEVEAPSRGAQIAAIVSSKELSLPLFLWAEKIASVG